MRGLRRARDEGKLAGPLGARASRWVRGPWGDRALATSLNYVVCCAGSRRIHGDRAHADH